MRTDGIIVGNFNKKILNPEMVTTKEKAEVPQGKTKISSQTNVLMQRRRNLKQSR